MMTGVVLRLVELARAVAALRRCQERGSTSGRRRRSSSGVSSIEIATAATRNDARRRRDHAGLRRGLEDDEAELAALREQDDEDRPLELRDRHRARHRPEHARP